ncbi:purine-nucleoside phosphorylase [Desulfuromonas acetoxidans]|uniref:Purine nucleoside phosphorylase n=1 Tax=Desulfuromonas acetoxidans (strain DSM 684 / 11070) TaxID=281689 RepID=Q1K0Y4_DESA6|nr:purine-nucleoside phosphorylase [Desulfuromonas acetoxidans]EAT16224.1 Inosine guanosine and xanthosine phosphorylase [Desulfuromonas acetoxidans DSM 684]MBF0645202.1 purine-nucleoside phosphorylase [Desulfuromonas acetoxidans]NVD23054.1 purine-nucleoside phosphorylase [Desulfuromonas acetoxidans]NVE15705.1 purine-nucleoside phosphorylase [Desulfuromonas acetoxidans]
MVGPSAKPAAWHPRLAGVAPCETAIILGSGWSSWAENLVIECSLDYSEVFRTQENSIANVPGHAGKLHVATWGECRLLVFQGRFHLYQGLTAAQVSQTAQLAHAMGTQRLVLTNAVGGIAPELMAGSFVIIKDHLNFQGDNPLRGLSPSPFIDLCNLYCTDFYPDLKIWADQQGIALHRGVLAAVVGPSYETPAEIRALERLGADVVSMSMVPEAIMARYLGLEVVGLSLVTNPAAGLSTDPLQHQEVLQCGQDAQAHSSLLLDQLLSYWTAAH